MGKKEISPTHPGRVWTELTGDIKVPVGKTWNFSPTGIMIEKNTGNGPLAPLAYFWGIVYFSPTAASALIIRD